MTNECIQLTVAVADPEGANWPCSQAHERLKKRC